MLRRNFLGCLVALMGFSPLISWADKPLSIVVPYAPGATTDLLGRLLAEQLSSTLKRNVIVENKPGAGTLIGAQHVAKATPDGSTLLFATSTTLAFNSSIYKSLPYDPHKDFAPVGLVSDLPFIVVVHPSVKANSLAELVSTMKAQTTPFAYGSAGIGSPQHLAGAKFSSVVGVKMNHIPYKGTNPALTDLLGGKIQVMFSDISPAVQHIKSGKLRVLAITSSQRHAQLPDVPTIAESKIPGTKDFEVVSWQCLVAPAATPPDIIATYNKALNEILSKPEIVAKFEKEGVRAQKSSPEKLKAFALSEEKRWAEVIKAANITAE